MFLEFDIKHPKKAEEGRRTYQPKRCEYNNEDEDNCPNIQSDKNYQASSQKS